MTTTKNQLTLLIMKFMDYLIQESGYYVTEKATIRTSDRREQGYRKQTRSTGDTRLKAIFWGFQLIQVSRDEMQNYAERYTLKHENDSEKLKKTDYTDILLKYIDEFIEDYFVFERADTKQRIDFFRGFRPDSKNESKRQESKYEMRFATVQPSRAEFEKHISFFMSTLNQ